MIHVKIASLIALVLWLKRVTGDMSGGEHESSLGQLFTHLQTQGMHIDCDLEAFPDIIFFPMKLVGCSAPQNAGDSPLNFLFFFCYCFCVLSLARIIC